MKALICNGCIYNYEENEVNVFCSKSKRTRNDGKPSISEEHKMINGLEIVPKAPFLYENVTCAAKTGN